MAKTHRLCLERLEQRNLLTGAPFGADAEDTGEFMLGRILVTPVFMESSGGIDTNSETWTPQQIASTKAKIVEGMTWWEDTLAAQGVVHSLEFEFDFTYADTPVSTPYEPISRQSNDFTLWIDDFFDLVGHNQSNSFSINSRSFNHAQREAFDTDWAFTIFVVNDANDADGFFEPGGSFFGAFSFAGGRFYVSPAGRPASTFAHEVGHMFWARDEHDSAGSYTDQRGYYDTPNLNATDNPAPGFQQVDSIMAAGTLLANAYANHTSSPTSLEMMGWRDSDQNGVYDVLDVPHQLTGSGYHRPAEGIYRFVGSASVQTLPNQNSSGLQNDITINRISEAQFRINGGAWQTAETYGEFTAELNLRIPVPGGFNSIEIRTVTLDPGTGGLVTASPIFAGGPGAPDALGAPGISGFVWYDVNGNGAFSGPSETGLAGATVSLVNGQGQPLQLQTIVEPDNFNHREPIVAAGASFSVIGEQGVVSAINNNITSTGGRVIGVFRQTISLQRTTWTGTRHLRIDFSSPVTAVQIDAVGNAPSSFGRLEVYDASNNLLGRYTSRELLSGQVETLKVTRPTAQIAYAIVKGHADTEVLLDNLHIGPQTTATVDAHGAYHIGPLPAGNYTVRATPPSGFSGTTPASGSLAVNLAAGQAAVDRNLGFRPAALLWHNTAIAADTNNDGSVDPIDALGIINDLILNNSRMLPTSFDVLPPLFIDVTGDGFSAPDDALGVINILIEQFQSMQEGEGEGGGSLLAAMNQDDDSNTLLDAEPEFVAFALLADQPRLARGAMTETVGRDAALRSQQEMLAPITTNAIASRKRDDFFAALDRGNQMVDEDEPLLPAVDAHLTDDLGEPK